ncbi:glycosyltransferase [Cellulomonas shaoxiangyii]|uniref:Glycosyltransferase family 1 protein n=1 Tax=Cellulomonas shaoxiangyii TaxID=2566013 RepID=A0A4P7SLN2_9CELL|nr:glycosyltransferase [Cellulomonas shaoxiangyii]QCB93724.1 glycosyltransferase family 1 protein [Cellulomonas shaoxiangyii]TGY81116.1 glycosyltransferase family 1 protein [Cellulomonas shaoxiangyii]
MRIAMVSEHASPLAVLGGVDAGGQNVHVAALTGALAERGHDVTVYTRRDDPALPERVRTAPGVEVVHVPAGPPAAVPKDDLLPWMPDLGAWVAADWATRGAPDVVHAHFWMSGLAALHAAEPHGVPTVQTYHALGSVKRRHQGAKDTSPAGRVSAEAAIGRRVDAVVATCSDEVRELTRLGVPPERVRTVPCGVDVDHFRPVPGAAGPFARTRRHRLVCLGRLVERKGVDTVLRALAGLPDAELLVAGGPDPGALADDAEATRLALLAERLGVAGRVHLLGRVGHADVPALVSSADLVVATPWYEPFGIVPLEAAACGVPVVGSAVGGLLDSVADGVTGVLVPARDPDALAAAVRGLLDDPARRRAMGAAARHRALARYSWRGVAAQTELVYRSLTSPARAAERVEDRVEEVAV